MENQNGSKVKGIQDRRGRKDLVLEQDAESPGLGAFEEALE